MSTFLRNLMARTLGNLEVVQPRLPSLFEPRQPWNGSLGIPTKVNSNGYDVETLEQDLRRSPPALAGDGLSGARVPAEIDGRRGGPPSEREMGDIAQPRYPSISEAARAGFRGFHVAASAESPDLVPHPDSESRDLAGLGSLVPQQLSHPSSHHGASPEPPCEFPLQESVSPVLPHQIDSSREETAGRGFRPKGKKTKSSDLEIHPVNDGAAAALGGPKKGFLPGTADANFKIPSETEIEDSDRVLMQDSDPLRLQPRSRPPAARVERGPRPSLIPSSPAEETVRVTIGRVDVRAIFPAPTNSRSFSPKARPTLSLDDYLKRRDGVGP